MTEKISEREDRINKLKNLKDQGIDPYPAKSNRTKRIIEILNDFSALEKHKTIIVIAGRLRALREHGNLTFAQLNDGSAKIQIAISKKEVGADEYKKFSKLIDVGDFIEVTGETFLTHKGEQSVMVRNFRILTKALRPLPDKWHGIQDEEDKLRKRYLDILFSDEAKEMFVKKARFWQAVREFLINKGFQEVETPVLENTTGGADARPFITYHNALDIEVYLRISMGELWQKRLMVAGFEKTFEIGRQFRNEGMDAEHLQDYTQMEFYWAYANYEDGMKIVEELFKYVAKKTFGTLKFKIGKFDVDLGKEWIKYDFRETVKKFTGIDVLTTDLPEVEAKLKELKVEYDKQGFNITRAIDNLWKYCRKQIGGPGFLVGVPVKISPLAKRDDNNKDLAQKFHPLIAGSELGNGYSELNDPIDQAERFAGQLKLREAGDEEAQMFDHDFVEALEYGMPPTCGFGMSERVFAFLMNKSGRECQIFPLMRPKIQNEEKPLKNKETKIAVALINKSAKLKRWEELNTVAHLNAAFGARSGKNLFYQDVISTKDQQEIKLNIQHAIIIKETKKNNEISDLIKMARENSLEISEFTREMIETTDDKKVIEKTKLKSKGEIEYLGVLIFGKKSIVEKLTDKFNLYN